MKSTVWCKRHDDIGRTQIAVAKLTLNDAGECRLKSSVRGEQEREYEFWQFRRKVLESLFFELKP